MFILWRAEKHQSLGSLSYAYEQFTCSVYATRVTRAIAVVWDTPVFYQTADRKLNFF